MPIHAQKVRIWGVLLINVIIRQLDPQKTLPCQKETA